MARVKSSSSWRVRDGWVKLGLVEEAKAFQAGGAAKAKAWRLRTYIEQCGGHVVPSIHMLTHERGLEQGGYMSGNLGNSDCQKD